MFVWIAFVFYGCRRCLVQIIKWEETMLCEMVNNEQLLYGYVILSLSKDPPERNLVAVV